MTTIGIGMRVALLPMLVFAGLAAAPLARAQGQEAKGPPSAPPGVVTQRTDSGGNPFKVEPNTSGAGQMPEGMRLVPVDSTRPEAAPGRPAAEAQPAKPPGTPAPR